MNARRTATATVLAATTAAGLALATAPAHAETRVVHDATHDVVAGDLDGPDNPTAVDASRTEGDALRMRVRHGAHRIHVRVRYAALSRLAGVDVVHVLALRTSGGRRAELDLSVADGRWQGRRTFTVDGRTRHCRGVSSHVDYAADTVTFVVPRSCVGDPRWVRVGAGTGVLGAHRIFADDVSLDSRVADELALGPVVRR